MTDRPTGPLDPIEVGFDLPVPPARVWRALTDVTELRGWFAEHAEVEPRVGGAYRFWGAHTILTPTAGEADQTITAWEPERRLAFDWSWGGAPTSVELTLEAKDYVPFTMVGEPPPPVPGCRLTARHTVEGDLPLPRAAQAVEDQWRLAAGNLCAWLDGDFGAVVLPDYADPSPVIRLSVEIDAPAPAVFRALLEPKGLNQWLAKDARVEPRVGGTFDLGWHGAGIGDGEHGTCRILALEPDRELSISWPDWRGDPNVPDQRVTFRLEPKGDATVIHLEHAGFVRTVDRSDYQQGWGGFAPGLAAAARGFAAAD